MKLAVVGSRGFKQSPLVKEVVARCLEHPDDIVVSGGAKGPDTWGEEEATARGHRVEIHYPDWHTFGRRAGALRNTTIVEACDRLVAFWDGRSRGTRDSIVKAHALGKPVLVVFPDGRMKANQFWSRPGNGA